MLYTPLIISIIEVIIVTVPVLLSVAFLTVAERKTMASMQRRLGPNIVGYYGLLQAFADALKLLLKEYISPTQANIVLFFLGPLVTLIFSLLGFSVIPYGPGLAISDFDLGILYMLAVSSLSTYGILLAGWSANSKYAFLGSLRSTAQLISYELILSSAILLVVLVSGSLSLTVNTEYQKAVWYVLPLLPIFIIFFIGSIAETNRAPFDLAEAESELVSGFMTEHAAVIFVFFFLAEYASILLICILTGILFLGGYLFDVIALITLVNYLIDLLLYLWNISLYCIDAFNIMFDTIIEYYYIWDRWTDLYYDNNKYYIENAPHWENTILKSMCISYSVFYLVLESIKGDINEILLLMSYIDWYLFYPLTEGMISGLVLGLKSCVMIFVFIWARASLPRIRYDQLMSFCWTILLPLVIAFIILSPCVLYNYETFSSNISLLYVTTLSKRPLNLNIHQTRSFSSTNILKVPNILFALSPQIKRAQAKSDRLVDNFQDKLDRQYEVAEEKRTFESEHNSSAADKTISALYRDKIDAAELRANEAQARVGRQDRIIRALKDNIRNDEALNPDDESLSARTRDRTAEWVDAQSNIRPAESIDLQSAHGDIFTATDINLLPFVAMGEVCPWIRCLFYLIPVFKAIKGWRIHFYFSTSKLLTDTIIRMLKFLTLNNTSHFTYAWFAIKFKAIGLCLVHKLRRRNKWNKS